ncbi:MAG: ATP phosphoribosyltransferase [Chloroflexota bacterium]
MEINLTLGLPNGSLQEPTFKLLNKIGMRVNLRGRSSEASVEGIGLFKRVIMMRPQDLPTAVLQGTVSCAICGLDWVIEQELDPSFVQAGLEGLARVREMNYAKVTRKPVRIVIFGRKDSPRLGDRNNPVRISSEYPNITRNMYQHDDVVFSHGSTEVKVAMGLFDYGVGVTETGSSIKAHDLVIVDTLLKSPTVLVAKDSIPAIELFGELLYGALRAENNKLLKMNVSEQTKDQLIGALPALQSPTLNRLADGSYAVETVVPRDEVADLIIKLRGLGATGILVQDLDIMLP